MPFYRLNAEMVVEMRQRYKDGLSFKKIGDEFGVHEETARKAVTGKTWKRVKARPIAARPCAKRGEEHGNAKLTEDLVRAIRLEYSLGNMTQQQIADMVGVSDSTISLVVNYINWGWLD